MCFCKGRASQVGTLAFAGKVMSLRKTRVIKWWRQEPWNRSPGSELGSCSNKALAKACWKLQKDLWSISMRPLMFISTLVAEFSIFLIPVRSSLTQSLGPVHYSYLRRCKRGDVWQHRALLQLCYSLPSLIAYH